MKLPKDIPRLTMTAEERRLRNKSLKAAETVIKEKVDLEARYIPEALYELYGRQLREVVAYAYRSGVLSGLRRGL